ncbi:MAG TPA: hypothetical protein VLX68_07585 [Chitinivibrionales bacterium]|nr:hypothetical protein [Chitinivibrionales bacterium]
MRRFHGSLKIIFLLAFLPAPLVAQPSKTTMFPGITTRQHMLVQEIMHDFFSKRYNRTDTVCREMRRLEAAGNLLPMSCMLGVATRAWRILNDEYATQEESEILRREVGLFRGEGLRILHQRHFADSTRPTRMFLEAGINGFNATLFIRAKPLTALSLGLRAYRTMDSVRTLVPQAKDVYLGLGLFQCALANEPGIIHFALRLFNGLYVSLDSGLVFLQTCADSAQYTRFTAKEYLIQFLSPFKAAEAERKQAVFKSLQAEFPGTAYYVFQEVDEAMAFHRKDAFSGNRFGWVPERIAGFDTSNYFLRRDVNLVRWQCTAIDSSEAEKLHPVPFRLRQDYSFYPVFLKAAQMRYMLDQAQKLSKGQNKKAAVLCRQQKERAISVLRKSEIDPMLREYFLWHIEDGLP